MMRISARLILLGTTVGLLLSGCASTDRSLRVGSFDTPSYLWSDDFAFHNNLNDVPPDWDILDISQESFDNVDDNWKTMGSDLFDIAK